jgi:hypothetical protein
MDPLLLLMSGVAAVWRTHRDLGDCCEKRNETERSREKTREPSCGQRRKCQNEQGADQQEL